MRIKIKRVHEQDVRYNQNYPFLAEARFDPGPDLPEQRIPAQRKGIFPEIRGVFAEMQITGKENMVTSKQEIQKQKAGGMRSLTAISEYSLSAFLENEPDLYSVSYLKMRYKYHSQDRLQKDYRS